MVLIAGKEHQTKKEKQNAESFILVEFKADHPTPTLRGSIYVKTDAFNARLKTLATDPSLRTGILRGVREKVKEMSSSSIPNAKIFQRSGGKYVRKQG